MSPQNLLDAPRASAESATVDRILDAALARFEQHGISATTMGELAADAGISRAWLYRHFTSREAVVQALVARQTRALVAEVMAASDASQGVSERLTQAFVHVVRWLLGNAMLRRILAVDREVIAPYLMGDAAPLMRSGVELLSAALGAQSELKPAQARRVSEAFVRLVASIAIMPNLGVDFENPRELRNYAAQIIPALLS